jgi:hypothetical protein
MDLLVFAVLVLIVAGIVGAIAYYIPFPPPVAWLKWAIPALALLVAAFAILQRMGAVA